MFYDLVEMFTFAILQSQANKEENSEYYFPIMTKDQGEVDYLKLAFMMPKEVLILKFGQHSFYFKRFFYLENLFYTNYIFLLAFCLQQFFLNSLFSLNCDLLEYLI